MKTRINKCLNLRVIFAVSLITLIFLPAMVDHAAAEMSIDYCFIQYRTYSDEDDNQYRGWVSLTKDGNLINASDVTMVALKDSSGANVALSAYGFWKASSYYIGYWNSSTSSVDFSGPESYSGFWIKFPAGTEIAAGSYTYEVTTSASGTLSSSFYYPGRKELPVVKIEDMEYEWLTDGGLKMSWENPSGDYERVRVALFDQDGEELFNGHLPSDVEELTIPAEWVQAIADETGISKATWQVRTESRTDEGMEYARGYSDSLQIPWPLASTEEIYTFERMWPALQQQWYFVGPSSIAMDKSGNIYVLSDLNNNIQKFTPDGQFITQWGSDGSGDGEFSWPCGIAIDKNENLYVADSGNHRIQKFTSDGGFIAKWGSWGSGDGEFSWPRGIAIDESGNVYVADMWNHRIQKFTSSGQFITAWGAEGTGSGDFRWPTGIAVDGSDYIYVADTSNHRIQKFTSDGQYLTQWGSEGSGDGEFKYPVGITINESGKVYVVDTGNYRIQTFSSDGGFMTKWGSFGRGYGEFDFVQTRYDGLFYWGGIAIDENGNVFVADHDNNRIQKFTSDGQFITRWGSQGFADGEFNKPNDIATFGSEAIYVADSQNNRIQKFTSEGQFITELGSEGSGDGEFSYPCGIAIDNNENLYVADSGNNRMQKFTSDGQFLTKWGTEGSGNGEFDSPWGIAIDGNGNVYVADWGNHRIQKFTSNGQFLTKWGTEGSGDGEFDWPMDIAIV
jgi:sugar lactone lactonase YvrE